MTSRVGRVAAVVCLSLFVGCNRDLAIPEAPERGTLNGKVEISGGTASAVGREVKLIAEDGTRASQLTTDGGAFVFGDLAPGLYTVICSPSGFTPVIEPAVRVNAGKPTALTLTLTSNRNTSVEGTLTGKVVVAGGGSPEGARVAFVFKDSMETIAVAPVDRDGTFTARVPPATYVLRGSHPLYLNGELDDVVLGDAEVKDVSSTPISLGLNPATLSGRVLKEVDGAPPAPAAMVQVRLESGETTTTDLTGAFTMQGLTGGVRQVFFSLQDYGDAARTVTLVPGPAVVLPDVTLTLRRTTVSGTIELADRQLAQGITVSLTGTGYSTVAAPDAVEPWKASYRLLQVPPGTYEVSATRSGYARGTQPAVLVTGAAPVSVPNIVLTQVLGDFSIDDGDPGNTPGYARDAGVTLNLTGFNGAATFRTSEDPSFAGVAFVPFTGPNQPFRLSTAQGNHVVYAEYKDAQGVTSPRFSASILFDDVPPTGVGLTLNGGQGFTNQTASLSLTVTAGVETGSGLARTRVSLTGLKDANGNLTTTPAPYQRDSLLPLPGGQPDGPVNVTVQVFDHAGNRAADATASVVIDTVAPVNPVLTIADGAAATSPGFTNTPVVTLTQGAAPEPNSGFLQIKLANSTQALASAVYQPLTTSASWFLDPSGPDLKHVYAVLRDAAGNTTSTLDAPITLDTVAPSPVSATLSGTSPLRTPTVTLALAATDANGLSPTRAVTLSEDPFFITNATVLPTLAATTPFTLSSGDGSKVVLVRFLDRAGNAASVSVPVTLDTQSPTGGVTVGNGQAIQSGGTFAVAFTGVSADVTRMLIAVDASAACATLPGAYVPYAQSSNRALTDGAHTLNTCLADAAGNFVALPPVTVTVDNGVPTVTGASFTGLSNQAAGITNVAGVQLVLTGIADATSGVAEVRVSTDTTFAGVAFGPAAVTAGSLTLTVTLPAGDGAKTLYTQVRDRAGLVSSVVQATATLDTQPPVWTADPLLARLYVNTPSVSVSFAATDNVDLPANLQVGFPAAATCAGATYQAYGSGTLSIGSLSPGANVLSACARDRAGNVAQFSGSLRVQLDTTAPLGAALVPNAPVALASGALISWSDTGTDTQRIEVDASKSPTFASGVRTNAFATGVCGATAITPPPTSVRMGLSPGDLPLSNLDNWYFRIRAVDCAGNPGPYRGVPGSAVPNLGSATLTEQLSDQAELITDGNDLWLHTAQNSGTRAELLLHCSAGTQDCRDLSNFAAVTVTVSTGTPPGDVPNPIPASMFVTDDTLYLVDTLTVGGQATVAMAWCDRRFNCELGSNWNTSGVPLRSLSNSTMYRPKGAVSGAALAIFYPLAQSSLGNTPMLSMTRCPRSLGIGCRQSYNWTSVDTPISIDPTRTLTAIGTDDRFYVGAVSAGAYGVTITSVGQPMLINCQNGCATSPAAAAGCTGSNCGCDGYVCGDFRFTALAPVGAGESLASSSPRVTSVGGRAYLGWSERRCATGVCADRIQARSCAMGAECGEIVSFAGQTAVRLISSSPTLPNGPATQAPLPVSLAATGGVQGPASTVRIVWPDVTTQELKLASCASTLTDCFASVSSTTLASGPGAEQPNSASALGPNLYVLGRTALGQSQLYQPVVSTPANFFAAPLVGQVRSSWSPLSSASGTLVTYGPEDGGATTTVSIADPFADTFTVPSVTPLRSSLATFSSGGIGDPSRTWSSTPFGNTEARTDLQSTMAVSIASPGLSNQATHDTYTYASYLGTGGVMMGRCNSLNDCSAPASWSWNTVTTDTTRVTNQITVDYPRNFSSVVSTANTPRVFIGGRRADNQFWISGCVLSGPASCTTPADFTTSRLDGVFGMPAMAAVAQPQLRVVGDVVQTVESDGNGRLIVRFCDGAHTYPRDGCTGAATDLPMNHCFNPANWRSVTLDGTLLSARNPVAGGLGNQVTGTPHPVYGLMAAQPSTGGGVILWTCAQSTSAGCTLAARDCTVMSNWQSTVVRMSPGGANGLSAHLDMTVSYVNYQPTVGANGSTVGVYLSYFDTVAGQWGVAQCRGAAHPLFPPWACAAAGSAAPAAATWSFAPVIGGTGSKAVASTVRVVNGDVVASFFEDDRIYLATCPLGVNCTRRSGWFAYPALSTVSTDRNATGPLLTSSWGYVAAGANNTIYLTYPSRNGSARTVNFLSGGSLTAR